MIAPELLRIGADLSASAGVYMLLDAARARPIHPRLAALDPAIPARSLYQGDIGAYLGHVSPWIVALAAPDGPAAWFAETGFGQSWGLSLVSEAGFEDVRRHLRKFNLVSGPDGRPLAFRFYDPRVLRGFLPACGREDLHRFFGPVQAFLVETQSADGVIRYTLEAGALRSQHFPLRRN